jgi:ubiquinone/menaquinone biosynthesis C-methylase UbiE
MENNLWQDLYSHHSDRYERLVQTEDYQGRLLSALRALNPIENPSIVELGAGTGRITVQLLPYVRHIYAFDLTPAMIHLAHRKLKKSGLPNWSLAIGDSRAVPLSAKSADIVIEGWSFVQIMTWHMENWRQEVGQAIQEMLRMVRAGGMVILVETLGTGETKPNPPARFLAAYEYFEREWQFSSSWIRTDYCFSTIEQVDQIVSPVFGEAMVERTYKSEEGIILPECTGIWWRSV